MKYVVRYSHGMNSGYLELSGLNTPPQELADKLTDARKRGVTMIFSGANGVGCIIPAENVDFIEVRDE
jgi:hypothetical protein